MHWSYPAALRFLRVLRGHGWTATTWQVQEAYRTAAPHSDAASLRCLLHECGVERWQDSVCCEFTGTSEDDRRVHRYWIPRHLRELALRILAHEAANPTPRGQRPDFAQVARVAEPQPRAAVPHTAAQAGLF